MGSYSKDNKSKDAVHIRAYTILKVELCIIVNRHLESGFAVDKKILGIAHRENRERTIFSPEHDTF